MPETIVYDATPKQAEFIDCVTSGDYSFILYGGAIRGGKTFGGIGAIIDLCITYPKSRCAVVRKDAPTLRRNTIPSFQKGLPSLIFQQGNWDDSYLKQDMTLTLFNGSQIIFVPESIQTDPDLNRFRGLEVNWFFIEEINEIKHITFEKCIERAGTHYISELAKDEQPKPKVFATCNPAFNWVKTEIYDKWKLNDLPKKWKYIPAKATDNPYVSEDMFENWRNMSRRNYDIFVNGNWEVTEKTGGEFWKSFDPEKNIVDCNYDSRHPLHLSFDENVHPYAACTIWQVLDDRVFLVDEVTMVNPYNTIRHTCKEIVKRYKAHETGMFVYGDATSRKADTKLEKGQNFFTIIMDELDHFRPSLRVPSTNPPVVMSGNFINHIFERGYNGIEINIGAECSKTLADLFNLKEKGDGYPDKKKVKDPSTGVTYEEWGHLSDTIRYFICKCFEKEFNLYRNKTNEAPKRVLTHQRGNNRY